MNIMWLCAYDINANSSRYRCLKILRKHSLIYQKSAFEVCLERRSSIDLLTSILANIDADLDRYLMLRVSAANNVWRLGAGSIGQDMGHLLIFR
jgi:CRISPR/Cas system-associated endoribonuclease Cas2